MVKEKRILIYFLGWLLLGIIVCFIGLSNVSASEIIVPGTAQFYDNSGTSLNGIDTRLENTTYFATFTTAANSYGGLVTFQLNSTLQEGRIYSIFLLIGAENYGGTTKPSTKPSIGIGRNYATATSSYINNTNPSSYSASSGTTGEKTRGVYYTFIANETGSYISVPYTSEYTCSNCSQYFSGYSLEDLGNAENLSQDEVNNIINNQTSIIQNDINNMEQSIVDSNKETQEVIKDQFNSCHDSVNLIHFPQVTNSILGLTRTLKVSSMILNGSTNAHGEILGYTLGTFEPGTYTYSHIITDNFKFPNVANAAFATYIKILNASDNYVEIASNNNSYNLSYQKTFTLEETTTLYIQIFINSNAIGTTFNNTEFKFQIQNGNKATSWEPYGEEICQNKIDETNNKLDGIQGALTDSSTTDMSSLSDSAGWLPAGPVDSILTLPLTMLNSLVSNLTNNSCQNISIELPFVKENITLPCVRSLYDKMGVTGTLFTTAGLIASAFILFNYLLALYKWVDDTLTMRENTMPGYFDDNWGGGA